MGTEPDQRHYPGETGQKCNPERDAAKPLFANQIDPPPERPWPATSDEGYSVPPPRPVTTAAKTMAATDVSEPTCLPDEQPRD
jgi:hypothetical protein